MNAAERIDHVNIATSDSAGTAERLSLLGFTEAWPEMHFPGLTSIGLVAGDHFDLAVDSSDGTYPDLASRSGARFATVAFAPTSTQEALDELDAKGILHLKPDVTTFPPRMVAAAAEAEARMVGGIARENEARSLGWTNTFLPGLLPDGQMAFLCEYTPDMKAMMETPFDAFRNRPKHPMGLIGCCGVVVSGPAKPWRDLLGDEDTGQWSFHTGPALRTDNADSPRG